MRVEEIHFTKTDTVHSTCNTQADMILPPSPWKGADSRFNNYAQERAERGLSRPMGFMPGSEGMFNPPLAGGNGLPNKGRGEALTLYNLGISTFARILDQGPLTRLVAITINVLNPERVPLAGPDPPAEGGMGSRPRHRNQDELSVRASRCALDGT